MVQKTYRIKILYYFNYLVMKKWSAASECKIIRQKISAVLLKGDAMARLMLDQDVKLAPGGEEQN